MGHAPRAADRELRGAQTAARHEVPPAPVPTCPSGAPVHNFAISAVDLPSTAAGGGGDGRKAAFVPTSTAAAVRSEADLPGTARPARRGGRMHPGDVHERARDGGDLVPRGALLRDLNSSGVNVGNNPANQTVAPGGTRTYTYFADTQKLESTTISDFGTGTGARTVCTARSSSRPPDPRSATRGRVWPSTSDRWSMSTCRVTRTIATSRCCSPTRISGSGRTPCPIRATSAGRRSSTTARSSTAPIDADMFSSIAHGDPTTPLLRAYAGDPVKVHVLGAPGSEQMHVFNLGGMSWPERHVHRQLQPIAEPGGGTRGEARHLGDRWRRRRDATAGRLLLR